MSDAADFRERFRQARQKRAQERTSSVVKEGVKRPRKTAPKLPSIAEASTAQQTVNKAAEADTLSKEELDRILMPPPGPLKKSSQPIAKESVSKPSVPLDKTDQVPSDVVSAEAAEMDEEKQLPDDFFEIESKKAKAQLDKERTAQRTDAEYLRFQQELDASMTSLTEKEAAEEEENERHRQEMEDYEQQQRLNLVLEFKEKRYHLPPHAPNARIPPSTSGETSMDAESPSDDEEEETEHEWRGKRF